jgi:hypothetical protein
MLPVLFPDAAVTVWFVPLASRDIVFVAGAGVGIVPVGALLARTIG